MGARCRSAFFVGSIMNKSPGKSVLMVDAADFFLACFASYLAEAGFVVRTASSGEAAFKILKQFVPDVIVTDLELPGMGGAKFLQRLKAADGKMLCPVIVFCARREMESFSRELGAAAFLEKTGYGQGLVQAINDIFLENAVPVQVEVKGPERKLNVLLAEDDPLASDAVREVFERNGHKVRLVENGPMALDKARRHKPDVILVKHGLPGLSGLRVAEGLQSLEDVQHIPVVVYGVRADARPATGGSGPAGYKKILGNVKPGELVRAAREAAGL